MSFIGWNAYRERDYALYNHLKFKVRNEILKSKRIWAMRSANKNLWTTVHSIIGTKASDPLMSLISQYGSIKEAVDDINKHLTSVFLPVSQDHSSLHVQGTDSWSIDVNPAMIMTRL